MENLKTETKEKGNKYRKKEEHTKQGRITATRRKETFNILIHDILSPYCCYLGNIRSYTFSLSSWNFFGCEG
jgi:hypothetical protein